MKKACLAIVFLLSGCAASNQPAIDTRALLGPWFAHGENFEIDIHEKTILFEFDMKEHPYQLKGDLLVIEFDDGVQRKRILRLTADELELRDEKFGTVSILYRKQMMYRFPK